MAEQPRAHEIHAKARPAVPARHTPVLSRYARFSGEPERDRDAPMDVPSRELPPDLGPEETSPVERLPNGAASSQQPTKRASFWKRLALPRLPEAPAPPAPQPAPTVSLEPVISRMLALEKQIAANQSATELRLEKFEDNLTRLWELEDQLAQTELRERLAVLEANQEEIADALHTVGRNLVVLASFVGTALAAGVLGLLFLL